MDLHTENWHAERRKGIGGSDVAAIFGLSHYATPLSIYLEKTGMAVPKFTPESLYWSSLHERTIIDHYKRENQAKVRCPRKPIINSKYHWLRGNLDGLRLDKPIVVEAKSFYTGDRWGPSGGDAHEVPFEYVLQVHHYMICTGHREAHIALLVGKSDYRQYTISYDQVIADAIIDKTHDFWFNNVGKELPPEPINREDVTYLYPTGHDNHVVVENDLVEVAEELVTIKQKIKSLNTNKKALEDQLIVGFGEHTRMLDPFGKEIGRYRLEGKHRRLRIYS